MANTKWLKKCGYESPEELAEKIDYEGGVPEFFLGYSGADSWKGTPLYDKAKKLEDAYQELVDYLDEIGARL